METGTLQELGKRSFKARRNWLSRVKRRLWPPSETLNTSERLKWLLGQLDSSARVLDLGSGERRLRAGVINLDIGPFRNVDVIGDGARLPFVHGIFDAVVCQGVLEHVCDPSVVVAAMRDVLRPTGYFYVEMPFMQGFHADPHDYHRCTLKGLEYLCRDFEKVDSGVCCGPSATVAWVLREYPALFFGTGRLRKYASYAFGWLTFWIKYLDVVLARHPQAYVIASAVFYLGRKGR
jgi:SAM-dependent methyltransferase